MKHNYYKGKENKEKKENTIRTLFQTLYKSHL